LPAHAIPFVITRHEETHTFYIGLRGSYCFSDFVIDLNASAVNVRGGLMHEGVALSASVLCQILEGRVVAISSQFRDYDFVLTGHSLGGAVAAALCADLRERHPELNISAIAFGAAASVSRNLWMQSREFCTTFVIKGDIVPFLSFHAIAHVSRNLLPTVLANQVREIVTRSAVGGPIETPLIDFESNPFETPALSEEELIAELEKEKGTRVTTELFPPGELYSYEVEGGDLIKVVKLRKITDCDYFSNLVKGLSEESHASTWYVECAQGVYAEAVNSQTA
jgi:hypothetical protein